MDPKMGAEAPDDLQRLPARSRAPLCVPSGFELALPSGSSPRPFDFWNANDDRCYGDVNITNTTVVVVPARPIEKLRKAVKKMQRLSRKDTGFLRKTPTNGSRSSSVRPADLSGSAIARYDGGRSSLRVDRGRRGLISETSSVADRSDMDTGQLVRENLSLRQRLDDEESNYRRKLDIYRQAQQHQATLVSRLQAKVLQYRKRCSDLENQVKDSLPSPESIRPYRAITAPPGSALDAAQQHLRNAQEERIVDLESALRQLNEERSRNEKLFDLNSTLRAQLVECQQTNEALTDDLQKLASDWQHMRDEMISKEEEWKEEEQFFNEYYNTEHNRMLNIWRDIVSVKRMFSDIQSSTQRDLQKLRNEINGTSNDVVSTCSSLLANAANTMFAGKQQEMAKENADLQSRINKLKRDLESAKEEIKGKDNKIQQLSKDVQKLKNRVSETDDTVREASQLQEEVDLLLNGLRDIAQTVILDADTKDADIQSLPHLHLSSIPPALSRSQSESHLRVRTTTAFVEGTISGVQAALHRYQSQIHELQVKLSSQAEQLMIVEKQNDFYMDNERKFSDRINDLTDELDSIKAEMNLLSQEKESLIKSLDVARTEKSVSDKNRIDLSNMLEAVNVDYEKMLKSNNHLQKIALSLEDEKNFLQNEVDRLSKELETREFASRLTDDRCSQMLEELLSIKEELHRTQLDKELLEQRQNEIQSALSFVEKSKGECESELQRVLMERSDVHDSLSKAETLASNLEEERKKLQEDLKNCEELKTKFQNQLVDLNNDLGAVRKELLHTEQNRLDLETEKLSLLDKCKSLETEKEKLEVELASVTHERNELSEQLANSQCKKDILNEELMRLRHRIEQVGETNSRINKHLEDLVKDCEEKQVMLETNEKEITHLQELTNMLKNEKESLEAMLFETQNNLETSELKRETMEKDIRIFLDKQESLKSEISKLDAELETTRKQALDTKTKLLQEMKALESAYKQTIENMRKQNEDSNKKSEEEKEQMKHNLEKRMQLALSDLDREKNDELSLLQKKIENLKQNIDTLVQQHDEALRRAESDKQQALLLAHQDQKAVLEKLDSVRGELEEEKIAIEKLRREANSRMEQDRSSINSLRDQVTRLTSKIDDIRSKAEEEKQRLENEIEILKKERDANAKESEDLKIELSLSEDRLHNIKAQLTENHHKLKEMEKIADNIRKELNDVRRQLNESNIEKDKYFMSNKELREFVKKSEAEKREQARSLEEAHQKINGLEDKIGHLEQERSRLQNVCRDVEMKLLQANQNSQLLQQELDKSTSSNLQKQNEEKDLLAKINMEIEDREKVQHELHAYKKQLVETERNLDLTQQELIKLRQHCHEEEQHWAMREQELIAALEDGRCRESKLEDHKHNLELCLTDSNQQVQDLKARLAGCEGRVRALDTQISQTEGTKKELENRLKIIGNVFKRLGGIQDSTITTPLRMLGHTRRWSPSRVGQEIVTDGRADSALEVDPEMIKKSVRSLIQQMAQIERERDDLNIQVGSMKKQLDEIYEVQNKNESKMTSMVQCIRQLNEEKGSLEIQLGQKESSLLNEVEALKSKTEENEQLRDKISALELSLQTGTEEKHQLEDRISKLKNQNALLEIERQKLKDELTKCESRSSRLELQRIALDGDLNRLQMALQERDALILKLQDRSENQNRTIASLEERSASLKSNCDQLHSSLEIAGSVEADLRAEIQSLQKSLAECTFSSQSNNDRIKQLQKTLSNNDNERRLLAERLERTERAHAELHAECKSRADQICALQAELDAKEIQKAHLEDQLRFAKYGGGFDEKESSFAVNKLQIECCELRGKIEMLGEKLRRVENEKKTLEHKLTTGRGKSYDRIESSDLAQQSSVGFGAGSSYNLSVIEHENKDLKQRCNQLETQLNEKENELARLRVKDFSRSSVERSEDLERYRAGQLRAEHLLKAREQSHRQQVQHLKNEINNLRKRLDQEMKLKRRYLLETPGENLRIRQLREALADSLRTVSQNPTLDALLLDHETKKLDSSLHLARSPRPRSFLPSSQQ